jgi:hypothetical protein
MEDDTKKINIFGTNNRYQIKKIINERTTDSKQKKRIQSVKWDTHDNIYNYSKQLQLIYDISNNNYNNIDDITKIFIQEINKKIYGYKQQDKLKKRYDDNCFLTFESVIQKMMDCQLKCRYCKHEMLVVYDILRENKQWSVDRIDNDLGHNINNFHLACLECNLSRRRRTDAKFLFTKQLNIVKRENTDMS